jgi:MoaA/NifB/PqqE/SkfB family radical SAM enzyme
MKVTNTAWGILGSRLFRRTFYARVHVTYRCNYRCRMCGIESIRPQFREMETEAYEAVAEQLRALGARHVVLTGGEPFLRADLAAIVGAFARRQFSVRIQTNGGRHVTRERVAEVARAGASDLSVSVDTLDGDLQDWIAGGSGTLPDALRTLDLALELMPRGMSLANIVASPHNFRQLPELVRHFGERGIYTYITPAMVTAQGESPRGEHLFSGEDATFAFANILPGVRDSVIDELVALRRRGWGLTNSTRHLRDFQRSLVSGSSAWACASGTLTIDVRPDGSVSACKEKPPLTNILDPGFARFYHSDGFRQRAAEQAASCSGCFYGEYREPAYAVRYPSVLAEWIVRWIRSFHRGMGWTGGFSRVSPGPGTPSPRGSTRGVPDAPAESAGPASVPSQSPRAAS